jgi:hypothetical protein
MGLFSKDKKVEDGPVETSPEVDQSPAPVEVPGESAEIAPETIEEHSQPPSEEAAAPVEVVEAPAPQAAPTPVASAPVVVEQGWRSRRSDQSAH